MQTAFRIAAVYVAVTALWILLSNHLIDLLVPDRTLNTYAEIVKGWLFAAVTAGLLYRLISRAIRSQALAEKLVQQKNEDLTAVNKELVAAQGELRWQLDELVRNQEQVRRQNECLLALRETAFALIGERDVDDILEHIVEKAASLGRTQNAFLYLVSADGAAIELKIKTGLEIQETGFKLRKGEGVVGKVWESGQPLVVYDYGKWPGRLEYEQFAAVRTTAGFPLKAGGKVVGVFGVVYTEPCRLDENELALFGSFAEMVSVALDNARLHSQFAKELAERQQAERELTRSQARMQAIFGAMPDAILRFSRDGVLLDYKLGNEIQTIVDFSDKVGKSLAEFAPAGLDQPILEHIGKAIDTRRTQQYEYVVDGRDGTPRHREMRIVVCGDNEVMAIVRDTTKHKEMEREIRRMSLVDQSTGLYNRAYFEENLRRMNDERCLPVGVIVCDIDGLKIINETFGYDTGDGLIMVAAGIISACCGQGDVAARIGGGEFAILMPNTGADKVAAAVRAIREETGRYREKTNMPLSISLGFTVRTAPADKMNDVFSAAGKNMHREKLHSKHSGHSAIVSTLAKALEARDFVTDGHADRLQEQMERLAVAAGLPASSLPDFKLFGRFHDIGKVGIPDNILFKPGRLTNDEYEIMKRHCEIGYRIALASPELAPIADWILRHQEWWNGGGYPLGLAGEEIPLPCRILAVVDAYDAMTHDRPYRRALTHSQAVAELTRCAGSQFDPDIVKQFLAIVKPPDDA